MNNVFVFGSNLAGRHGKGAALTAHKNYGAVMGQGRGRISPEAYAIPTKDKNLKSLSLGDVDDNVYDFYLHTLENPHDIFMVTAIGSGLAGNKIQDIKEIFSRYSWGYNTLFMKEFIT